MALWPFRPLGRQGGEVDRDSKGAKGEVGLAKGSPFHPTHPGLVRCNDFKDASKAVPLLTSPQRRRHPYLHKTFKCELMSILQPVVAEKGGLYPYRSWASASRGAGRHR